MRKNKTAENTFRQQQCTKNLVQQMKNKSFDFEIFVELI